MSPISRPSGRAPDALRALSFTRRFTKHAEGSVLVTMGDTRVLCTDSVLDKLPPHKKGSGEGWVTAEYGMLPRSTHTRSDREAARGKQSGRTQEIQRLIGRSLRAVVDLKKLATHPAYRLRCAAGRRRHTLRQRLRRLGRGGRRHRRLAARRKMAETPSPADRRRLGRVYQAAVLDLDYEELGCDTHERGDDRQRRYRRGAGTPRHAFSRATLEALLDLASAARADHRSAKPSAGCMKKFVIASGNRAAARD